MLEYLVLAGLVAIISLLLLFWNRFQRSGSESETSDQTGELSGKLKATEDLLRAREEELENLRAQIIALNTEKGAAEQNLLNLRERLDNQKQEVQEVREQLQKDFKLLADQILKENSKEFSKVNAERMENLLTPLKNKFTEFEKKVEANTNDQKEWRGQLKEQIDGLKHLNEGLRGDAQNLAKALKGDSKMQGGWGERILERVLENSGLEKGREYQTQFTDTNEAGQTVRPDVVVFLPDDKHLIIDSKVSLTAYVDYVNEADEAEREKHIRNHLISFKTHIKELSDKNYASAKRLDAPDFVMLFVYSEAAFALALENDDRLFEYGWDKRIVIVSPTTLMATLQTIASIWKYEKQNKNVQEISHLAQSLIKKFRGFIKNFEKIETQLARSMESFSDAKKQLSTGPGNVLRTLDKIRDKSGDTTKLLPDSFDEEMERAEEEDQKLLTGEE